MRYPSLESRPQSHQTDGRPPIIRQEMDAGNPNLLIAWAATPEGRLELRAPVPSPRHCHHRRVRGPDPHQRPADQGAEERRLPGRRSFPSIPSIREMHGLPCYPDVAAIGAPCDLAIVAVPAAGVAQAIRDCGKAGIPFAVVLTAGFRETGAEGRKLEAELKRRSPRAACASSAPTARACCRSRRACGPRSAASPTRPTSGRAPCPARSSRAASATPSSTSPRRRAWASAIASRPATRPTSPCRSCCRPSSTIPARRWPSPTWRARPTRGRCWRSGRKSLETGKPVLIWKAGTTDAGVKAAASHTANMTGSYDLYRAALRQSGLIEVDDVEPIVDIAKLFAQGRLPKGNAVGVLSISGGSGIVFADAAVRGGLTLPPFAPQTLARCARSSPRSARRESGRHHGRRLQQHDAVHRHARDRAGGPGPRPAVDPAGLDLGASRRGQRGRDRRGRRADRQAGARRLVRPARQVGRRAEGLGGGGRAVRHHAGAAGAGRRRAGPLRRRPPAPAAAQGAGSRLAEGRSSCRPAP